MNCVECNPAMSYAGYTTAKTKLSFAELVGLNSEPADVNNEQAAADFKPAFHLAIQLRAQLNS